jgi:hypothetical protein
MKGVVTTNEMNGILKSIPRLLTAALLLLPPANANEAICKPQKTKKVSRLCIRVINQSGGPQENTHLAVFDGEKQIAEGVTGSDGKYSFDSLQKGTYKVKVHADGFIDDAFPIVVTGSSKKCNHAVEVLLHIGWLPCTGMVRFVKP